MEPGDDAEKDAERPAAADLPTLSVVVPAHDAVTMLAQSLKGLAASTVPFELVVVDDASTAPEPIRDLAKAHGAIHHRLEVNSGPGAARNVGVKLATGRVVVFVDSDVIVHPDALERFQKLFAEDHELTAAFGSYDDRPAAPGIVSQYRNLLHHYTHHQGKEETSTFWAGLGAMRREDFLAEGGFSPKFDRPSIEDIELGMRLFDADRKIRLRPEIQCTHLKRWTLWGTIQTDVLCRAIPWTRLLMKRDEPYDDLNLRFSQKVSVALTLLALAWALVAWLFSPTLLIWNLAFFCGVPLLSALSWRARNNEELARPAFISALVLAVLSAFMLVRGGILGALPIVAIVPVILINQRFYHWLADRRNRPFMVAAMALHLAYFAYGGLAWLYAHVVPDAPRKARSDPEGATGHGAG